MVRRLTGVVQWTSTGPEREQDGDAMHPLIPLIDIEGAVRAKRMATESSMPSSERSAPMRLMMTPRKQQWTGLRSDSSPHSDPSSPRIAARRLDASGTFTETY